MYHSIWVVNNNLNKRKQRNGARTVLFRRPQQFCALQWKALMVWWMRWDLMAPLWRLQSLCCQRGSLKSWTFRPNLTQRLSGTLREKMHDRYSKVLKSVMKSLGIYVEHYPYSTFVKAITASNMFQSGRSSGNCAEQIQKNSFTVGLCEPTVFNNDVSCTKREYKGHFIICFTTCNIFLFWTHSSTTAEKLSHLFI